jgi:hypothetical protein
MENLFRRRVLLEKQCLICVIEVESLVHILWNCPSAQDV